MTTKRRSTKSRSRAKSAKVPKRSGMSACPRKLKEATQKIKYLEETVARHAEENPQRNYWDDVRREAKDFAERWKKGEFTSREEALDRLHEELDSNGRVFITHKALETLVYSDNPSAYIEEFGSLEGVADRHSINWSALAFPAFQHDVMEQIEAEGVNINDDPPREGENEE